VGSPVGNPLCLLLLYYVQKCNKVVVVAKVVVVVKSHRFLHVFPPFTTFQCGTLHSKKKRKEIFTTSLGKYNK